MVPNAHIGYELPGPKARPLLAGGDHGQAVLDHIRMLFERNVPPLSVSEAEVDEGVGLLRTSLDEALRGRND
jgi:hypothetical protein